MKDDMPSIKNSFCTDWRGDVHVVKDSPVDKSWNRQPIPPGQFGIVEGYYKDKYVQVRDPSFEFHKDLLLDKMKFHAKHLELVTAEDEAQANAKAAAAAAEQEALDLLPWDNSKHTRKDLEKRLPLGAKVQHATQCTGESIFENGKFIMQPSMVGVVKVYKDPITNEACLSFTYYCAVVEHEGLLGPTSTSYHPSTLELVPAGAEADI
jgi:hypothetical protein